MISTIGEAADFAEDILAILPMEWPAVAGTPSVANAPAVIAAITTAASLARQEIFNNACDNPIQKSTLYAARFSCPAIPNLGMLDDPQSQPVMLLHTPVLKVVPLTIHIPISEVPGTITAELITSTAHILDDSLRRDFPSRNHGSLLPVSTPCGKTAPSVKKMR